MPNRNTMVVPCMVKNRLNVSGGSTWRPDQASCSRIVETSRPAMTMKTSAVTTYMIPSRLWSTVTTHSWRRPSVSRCAAVPCPRVIVSDRTLMLSSSPQSQQVGGDLVELVARELHGRHERARFDRGRIVDPSAQRVGHVRYHPGADRRPAHDVGEIGPEHAVCRGPAHGVAVDAREGGEQLASLSHADVVGGRQLLRGHPPGKVFG